MELIWYITSDIQIFKWRLLDDSEDINVQQNIFNFFYVFEFKSLSKLYFHHNVLLKKNSNCMLSQMTALD